MNAAATDVIGASSGRNDTQIVPGSHGGHRAPREDDQSPPPPIVIPPKRRAARTARQLRRRRGLIVLIIILLLGLAAGITGWWFAAGRYSRIPNVTNQSLTAAEQSIRAAGYKVGSVTTAFDHTVPNGDVRSTSPGRGSHVARGTTVSISVSMGKDMVSVPSLNPGATQADVEAAMQAQGITITYAAPAFNSTVPTGAFVSSSPAAGTKVERGYATVTITLSKGPDYVSIPALVPNTSFDDEQQILTDLGFKVAETDVFSSTVPKGTVISIAPSDKQVRGQTVTATVSKGPQMVKIPDDLRGKSSEAASAELTSLGLQVTLDTSYDGGIFDRVADVSPKAGKSVAVGSTVTLVVV